MEDEGILSERARLEFNLILLMPSKSNPALLTASNSVL